MFSTQAIVIHHIQYGDHGLILKSLTPDKGMSTFFLNRCYSKGRNKYPFLFSPLSIIEISCKSNSSGSMNTISTVELLMPFKRIAHDFFRSAITVFMAEMLLKTLVFENSGPNIFKFVQRSTLALDSYDSIPPCFPIYFGFKLAALLGFAPENQALGNYFHLEKGMFVIDPAEDHYCLGLEQSLLLKDILQANDESIEGIKGNATLRRTLLDNMLIYYQLHIPESKEIQSAEILRELLK